MSHYTYFEGDRHARRTRLKIIVGTLVAAGLIALVLFSIGAVGREHPTGETPVPTTTSSCDPFCLPADRPVPQ